MASSQIHSWRVVKTIFIFSSALSFTARTFFVAVMHFKRIATIACECNAARMSTCFSRICLVSTSVRLDLSVSRGILDGRVLPDPPDRNKQEPQIYTFIQQKRALSFIKAVTCIIELNELTLNVINWCEENREIVIIRAIKIAIYLVKCVNY